MNFRMEHRNRLFEVVVDITPLIDVVFLLLIFFMVTTTFVVSPGHKVELPKSTAQEITAEKRELIVVLTKEGRISFEAKFITVPELRGRLTKLAETRSEDLVIIQADYRVNHGRVVEIMDAAKNAGFRRLAIATEHRG